MPETKDNGPFGEQKFSWSENFPIIFFAIIIAVTLILVSCHPREHRSSREVNEFLSSHARFVHATVTEMAVDNQKITYHLVANEVYDDELADIRERSLRLTMDLADQGVRLGGGHAKDFQVIVDEYVKQNYAAKA